MQTSEKEIESRLNKKIKNIGGRSYKWVSPGNAGVPDRIVILPNGIVCFVELKTVTGRLSKIQKVQIQRLKSLGASVFVLRGKEEVDIFIKEVLDAI